MVINSEKLTFSLTLKYFHCQAKTPNILLLELSSTLENASVYKIKTLLPLKIKIVARNQSHITNKLSYH